MDSVWTGGAERGETWRDKPPGGAGQRANSRPGLGCGGLLRFHHATQNNSNLKLELLISGIFPFDFLDCR